MEVGAETVGVGRNNDRSDSKSFFSSTSSSILSSSAEVESLFSSAFFSIRLSMVKPCFFGLMLLTTVSDLTLDVGGGEGKMGEALIGDGFGRLGS